MSLVRNASFLIVKNSGVREEVSDVKKSLCKNIFFVSSRLCTSPLVRAPPQLTLFTSPTPPSTPRRVRSIQFRTWTLEIFQSPDKFTGKHLKKPPTFTFKFTLRSIYGVNDTATWDLGVVFFNRVSSHLPPFPPHRPHPSLFLFIRGSLTSVSSQFFFIWSIHPSMDRSIDPSVHPSIIQSIYPLIDLSIDRSIDRSIDQCIDRSIHQSIESSIHRYIDQFINPSI